MEKDKCAKCGSTRLIPNLPLETINSVPFVAGGKTWAGFPVGQSTFTATVCTDCGYTEFYATDPNALAEEWRKRNA